MTDKRDDGGPACPHEADYVRGEKMGEYVFNVDFHPGLSLRDYFAAHASDKDVDYYREYKAPAGRSKRLPTKSVVEARYLFADAMLKERKL